MSTLWTPGRSPLHPCQSLKHLTSNHCTDSGAAGYHVSFAFNLAIAVSSYASGPLPAVYLSYLGLTTGDFFFEVCVSPTIIKAKCLSFYSLLNIASLTRQKLMKSDSQLFKIKNIYIKKERKEKKMLATQSCHLILYSIYAVKNKAGVRILVPWCLTGSLNPPWQDAATGATFKQSFLWWFYFLFGGEVNYNFPE